MNNVIEEIYAPILTDKGFVPDPDNHRYGPMGMCWRLSEEVGTGYYWTYGQDDLFDIRIHDFAFHEDTFLEFRFPELLNISWYTSVSGE